MAEITLRQLRYFEAVARHRNFGRAADVVAVSQPALSVQIKALEACIDARLFDRGARAATLTPFGEAFAPRVRDILERVDALGEVARLARGRMPRRLRLGIIPTIAPYLLPSVAAALSEAHPATELEIRETMTARLVEEIGDGRLDAAIVALPVSEPGLIERPLFKEPFVLVRPSRAAGSPLPTPEGLDRMRLLLLEEGHCFRDQALAFCRRRTARPRRTLDGTSLSTLVQMVAADMGVTLIPRMAVAIETRAAAVTWDRFPTPEPTRTVGLAWRRASPLSDALEAIRALLQIEISFGEEDPSDPTDRSS